MASLAVACGGGPTAPPPLPNQAPARAGSIPDQTLEVGEAATLGVSQYFTDADGDVLSYAASSSDPSVVEVSAAGATVTITPVAKGAATVTVTATDPGGLSAIQTLRVTVPNRPPELVGPIPAQTVEVGRVAMLDLSPFFTDADGDVLSYAASSSDPSVVEVSAAGATVTITPVAKGAATVTVTATDPGGLSAIQTFRVTVPNRPPEFVGPIPAQTVEVGRVVVLDLSPFFTDPDGDALSYAAATTNSPVSTASVSGAVVTIQGVAVGEATLTVTAGDPEGGSATQEVRVTVIPSAPDLAFIGVFPATATLPPGGSVTFEFQVRNQGTVASSATTIRAMRSANPIVSTRDTELRSFPLGPLAASEDRRLALTITVDASTAAGTVYIGMCIDSVTGEFDTRNNCSEGARLTIAASSTGVDKTGGGPPIRIRAPLRDVDASGGNSRGS